MKSEKGGERKRGGRRGKEEGREEGGREERTLAALFAWST